MSNFSLKVNLLKVAGSRLVNVNGQRTVLLPITDNGLFEGEVGVYLNLVAIESKSDFSTHCVKPELPRDVRDAMSQEKLKELCPIVGSMRPIVRKNQPIKQADIPSIEVPF